MVGRLPYVAQTSRKSTAKDTIPIHTTILKVLTAEIHFYSVKEKGLPSYKNEYAFKFNLYEESTPGRKGDSKSKKKPIKIYFSRPRPDEEERKVMRKEIRTRKNTSDVV